MRTTAVEWSLSVGFVGLVLLGIVAWASASGERDFCYIHRYGDIDSTGFLLKAHVPWRHDRSVARTSTLEEAVAAAGRIGCPLR